MIRAQVGSNGVLSIESSNSIETFVEVTEGMEIDRGYISPQFVTNSERLLVEYDNCRVLVTDQKIESVRDIVPILEQVRAAFATPHNIYALLRCAVLVHVLGRVMGLSMPSKLVRTLAGTGTRFVYRMLCKHAVQVS
jgi:hypothetical protein